MRRRDDRDMLVVEELVEPHEIFVPKDKNCSERIADIALAREADVGQCLYRVGDAPGADGNPLGAQCAREDQKVGEKALGHERGYRGSTEARAFAS